MQKVTKWKYKKKSCLVQLIDNHCDLSWTIRETNRRSKGKETTQCHVRCRTNNFGQRRNAMHPQVTFGRMISPNMLRKSLGLVFIRCVHGVTDRLTV